MKRKTSEKFREVTPEALTRITGGINLKGLIYSIIDYIRNPFGPIAR